MPGNDDFDKYTDCYTDALERSVKLSGYSSAYFVKRKVSEMQSFMKRAGGLDGPCRILDFGCGIGMAEPHLADSFPGSEIYGTDISAGSVARAIERNRGIPGLHYREFDGQNIPFEGRFDIILVAGVLHHIRRDLRPSILSKLNGILNPSGTLFIFEHNPWNPLTRHIVKGCPFDENADLLAPPAAGELLLRSGFPNQTLCFIHFFPALLQFLTPLEHLLRRLPLGAQYYIAAGR